MYLTNWKMTYEGHKNLSCKAPCSMYSVLFEKGIIDDPFYGLNEKDCEFVGHLDRFRQNGQILEGQVHFSSLALTLMQTIGSGM